MWKSREKVRHPGWIILREASVPWIILSEASVPFYHFWCLYSTVLELLHYSVNYCIGIDFHFGLSFGSIKLKNKYIFKQNASKTPKYKT